MVQYWIGLYWTDLLPSDPTVFGIPQAVGLLRPCRLHQCLCYSAGLSPVTFSAWWAGPRPREGLVFRPFFPGQVSSVLSGVYTLTSLSSLQLLWLTRDGIRKRTLSLGFLGIISRVLRLDVSTLVFCLSTRCYSWTNFNDWLFCINFWNHRGSMFFCQVFLLCLHQ